jgi:hypothetical protein
MSTISATGTPLTEYTAKQRIKAIIDADPRIKSEIDARIAELCGQSTPQPSKAQTSPPLAAQKGLRFLLLPRPFRVHIKKPYTQSEVDAETKRNCRDQAIYAQYISDDIFAARVDAELA